MPEPLWRERKRRSLPMKQKHHGVKDQPSPAPCKAGSWADDPRTGHWSGLGHRARRFRSVTSLNPHKPPVGNAFLMSILRRGSPQAKACRVVLVAQAGALLLPRSPRCPARVGIQLKGRVNVNTPKDWFSPPEVSDNTLETLQAWRRLSELSTRSSCGPPRLQASGGARKHSVAKVGLDLQMETSLPQILAGKLTGLSCTTSRDLPIPVCLP